MNTEVEAFGVDAEPVFRDWERRLSRFDDHSELSAMNRAVGGWFAASPLLLSVIRRAVSWADETDGLFDPTILPALERAGYSRSFELVTAGGPALAHRPAWRHVRMEGDEIFVAERMDLGGLAKGMAVDEVLRPYARGLVNAGGDLYAKGAFYMVGVEDPRQPERDLLTLRVRDRGVATSSTRKRRWEGGHHLIDPRTGAPSRTDALASTVIAGSAEEAEVSAKVALLLGLAAGCDWLEQRGLAGLLIGNDGALLVSAGFEEYVAAG